MGDPIASLLLLLRLQDCTGWALVLKIDKGHRYKLIQDTNGYKRLIPYILALVFFIATIFLSFHFISYWQFLTDEGIPVYSAKRILEGQVMYRDFFDIVPPFTNYLIAFAYYLFGVTLKVARLTVIMANALGVVMLWFISHRIVKNKYLSSIPVILMVIYIGSNFVVSHHWFALDETILTLWLTIRCLDNDPCKKYQWILLGIGTAILFLTIQSIGLALYGMLFIFIIWYLRQTSGGLKDIFKSLSYFTLSFILPVLFIFLLFYLAGALKPMFYDLFVWPWGHYVMMNNESYIKDIIYSFISYNLKFIFLNIMPFILIVIVLLVYLIQRIKSVNKISLNEQRLVALATVMIPTFVSSFISTDYYFNILLMPLDVLLIIMLIEYSLTNKKLLRRLFYAYLVIFSAVEIFNSTKYYLYTNNFVHSQYVVKLHTSVGNVIFPRMPKEYLIKYAQADSLSLMHILNQYSPTTIFVINWSPIIYFLTGATNPTILNTYVPCYNTSDQAKVVIHQLEQSKTPFIITDNYLSLLEKGSNKNINPCVFDQAHDILYQWIIRHYTIEKTILGYTLYKISK